MCMSFVDFGLDGILSAIPPHIWEDSTSASAIVPPGVQSRHCTTGSPRIPPPIMSSPSYFTRVVPRAACCLTRDRALLSSSAMGSERVRSTSAEQRRYRAVEVDVNDLSAAALLASSRERRRIAGARTRHVVYGDCKVQDPLLALHLSPFCDAHERWSLDDAESPAGRMELRVAVLLCGWKSTCITVSCMDLNSYSKIKCNIWREELRA